MIYFHDAVKPLLVPAEQIKPHPRNPNNGDIDAIVESLHVNGCYRPIYVAKESKEIVAGHHLYTALLQEGHDHVPVMWVDGDTTQARRILLGDNRIAQLAKIDDGLLRDLLEDVSKSDSLLGTGYTEADLLELAKEDDPQVPEDHAPFESTTIMTCPECGHSWGIRKEEVF